MALNPEQIEKITKIFFPYASKELDRFEGKANQVKGKLVHYTTADGALKILQTQHLWLRNVRVMSDWNEVWYGIQCVLTYLRENDDAKRQQLLDVMNDCVENSGVIAFRMFDNLLTHNQFATYIGCFSEHKDSEDNYGRLSMWRAFGRGVAGVALVLKPPDRGSSLPLKVAMHRVAYSTKEELQIEFDQVLSNIKEHRDFLKEMLPDNAFAEMVYRWLMITIVSLKHRGFHEENEWRLIYSPTQYESDHMEQETITRDGIPQLIYKIPLINKPDANIRGIEIPELLDRIIIGPTAYSNTIYDSILKELITLGVENASQKIFVSDIPIR